MNPSQLVGPVTDDLPTRKFVAEALAGRPDADDAFVCPILQDLPPQPVVWRGAGINEQHVFDARESRAFLATTADGSPATRAELPPEVTLRSAPQPAAQRSAPRWRRAGVTYRRR